MDAQAFSSNWRLLLPQLKGWPLIPVGAGTDCKAPVDPVTGKGMKDWQSAAFTPEQIAAMNGIVRSVGTRTGPDADFVAFIDVDGTTAIEFCRKRECSAAQCGWAIRRSTSKERLKVAIHIPEGLRHFLQNEDGSPIGKVVLNTKPAVYDLDDDGNPKRDAQSRLITLEPAEQIELFYGTGQCIVLGEHVKSGGHYTWDGSPAAVTDPSPQWWQLITDVLERHSSERRTTARSPRPSAPGAVIQSGPGQPCPICGRNTSGACTLYTDSDRRRINCFEGQSFQPPADLTPGKDILHGRDNTLYAFTGHGFNPAVGGFSTFVEHVERQVSSPLAVFKNEESTTKRSAPPQQSLTPPPDDDDDDDRSRPPARIPPALPRSSTRHHRSSRGPGPLLGAASD
jgi:hypothetical protein